MGALVAALLASPPIWFSAGLELGTWRPGAGAQDVDHGVVAELEAAATDHVAWALFFRFQGFAHGIDECPYVSQGSIVDVAAGGRFDLFDVHDPRRVHPHASVAFGVSRIDVRPDCGSEYSDSELLFVLGLGTDINLWRHFGVRPEARLSVTTGPTGVASPTGRELSGAFLLFVTF